MTVAEQVRSPELGSNNFRDYSGLRMRQHPFMGKPGDAMYVEYTGAGSGPVRRRCFRRSSRWDVCHCSLGSSEKPFAIGA